MKKKTIIIIVSILVIAFLTVAFFAMRSIPKQVKEVKEEASERVEEITTKNYISLDNEWIQMNKNEIKSIRFVSYDSGFKDNAVDLGNCKAYFSDGYLNIYVAEQTTLKNNLTNIFKDWKGLEEVSGFELLDLSEITSLNGAFQNSGVKKVDFSNTNLSNLISAENAFADCKDLVEIHMPGTMSSLKNTKGMFKNCFAAETIDLQDNHFSFTDASYMFSGVGANMGCVIPATFYIDSIDNAAFMFESSRFDNYQELVDHIKTDNTTNLTSMFESTPASSLNLSSWNVEKVKKLDRMFFDMVSLATLDISNWNLNSLKSCSEIFANCSSLIDLKMNWKNVNSLKYTNGMFASCASLEEIDVSFLDGANLTNADSMFEDCCDLKTIYGKGFMSFSSFNMFESCSTLDPNLNFNPFVHKPDVKKDGSMAQSKNGYFTERKAK